MAAKNDELQALSTAEKVVLFRTLFRGRNDDRAIYNHLAGAATTGVYPLLPDDTCHFLAVDFDEADWREDARAFARSCRELDIPVALEISRSGNGAHAWIFFAQAIAAREARRLGTAVISHACAHSRQLKLSSPCAPRNRQADRRGFRSSALGHARPRDADLMERDPVTVRRPLASCPCGQERCPHPRLRRFGASGFGENVAEAQSRQPGDGIPDCKCRCRGPDRLTIGEAVGCSACKVDGRRCADYQRGAVLPRVQHASE